MGALRLQCRLEPGLIDREAVCCRNLLRQFARHSEGVVEQKRFVSGDDFHPQVFQPRKQRVEALGAGRQRAYEALLFRRERAADEAAVLFEVGIADLELVDRRIGESRGEGLAHARLARHVDRPAQHPAQYVASAFVAWHHAITDQHGGRTAMLGHRADRVRLLLCRLAAEVVNADDVSRRLENRQEDVCFEHRALALEHRCHAFQATAGVDILRRQIRPAPVRRLVELHKHQVPDFEEAVVVKAHTASRLAVRIEAELRVFDAALGEVVIVDFAVRAARAARPRSAVWKAEPVVQVLVPAMDALLGQANLAPVAVGVVVGEEDGGVQPLGLHPVDLRHQLPGHLDRFTLEVIAEAEVAHHLEGRAMAQITHLFDVRRTETALHGGCARAGGRLFAHELRFELLHPRTRKHGCRVADRDKGPRRQQHVATLLEEHQERVANFVGGPWRV